MPYGNKANSASICRNGYGHVTKPKIKSDQQETIQALHNVHKYRNSMFYPINMYNFMFL